MQVSQQVSKQGSIGRKEGDLISREVEKQITRWQKEENDTKMEGEKKGRRKKGKTKMDPIIFFLN